MEDYFIKKDGHVIRSTIVASTTRISSVSIFSDLIWDRSEYEKTRSKEKGARIHWQNLFELYGHTHHDFLVSIMEFAYALMFDPVEEDLKKDTKTVLNHVCAMRDFLEYIQVRHLYNIEELDHFHIQDFLKWLLYRREASERKVVTTEQAALEWAAHRIRALQTYHRYGKRVSRRLKILPLHGQGVFKHLGKRWDKGRENQTPIIPKIVWDPYLRAALDYVEVYSDDILQAQELIEEVRSNVSPKFIESPNFCSSNFVRDKVDPILISMHHDFTLNPETALQWRKCWEGQAQLLREMRALHDACLVVIGSLSGIRESELALLDVEGYWKYTAELEPADRYRISTRLTKGGQDKKLEWEVNKPVFDACTVLAKLTSYARAHVDFKEMFIQAWDISPTLRFSADVKKTRDGRNYGKTTILPVGSNAFTRCLKRFANHLEEAVDGQYRLPHVDGRPWIFVARMLRRSLAGRIAREPFGLIAGMLHYKHVKLTTFAGYAGTDPEWLTELRDEEIAANDEFLEEIWDDLQDDALAGGKGEELVRQFSGMAGNMKRNAHRYFLESHRANLHVGLFNYCMFQKDRALCLTTKSPESSPKVNACHPDKCANSCITRRHLPHWEVQIDDARAMIAHKKTSELQRVILSEDLKLASRVVNRLKDNK
jgi:hypothetical protein